MSEKDQLRKEIAAQTSIYLKSGKRITHIPGGQSGEDRPRLKAGKYVESGRSVIKASLKKQRTARYAEKSQREVV